MGLGVLTKRGQQAVEQERVGVGIFTSHNPDLTFIATPKDRPSRVDGVLVDSGGVIRAVVESKSRFGLTLEKFRSAFRDEWLITYEKLVAGAEVAGMFCVPLVGFLHLVEDSTLLTIQLADEEGAFCVPLRIQRTVTTRDINGGQTCRNNAFVPMGSAKVFVGKMAGRDSSRIYPWGEHQG